MATSSDLPVLANKLFHSYIAPNLGTRGSTPNTAKDFVVTIWIALAILAVRLPYERVLLPRIRKSLEGARGPAAGKAAFQVMDNIWIAFFSGTLSAFAWYATVAHNGGCMPWHPTACFRGWPDHPTTMEQRLFMILAFAYYLYELIGTAVGVGTRLKTDMIAHHVATMALDLIAYETNLIRMSVMWQALFDISNPILHTAKALHASGVKALEPVKWAAFNLFALSFLVCRVLAGPVSILWPSFTVAPTVLPVSYCYTCWGLILFVYVLQLVWFYKIVQIAVQGDKAADKED